MKLLFMNWALVLVWCHFVACSIMAIKCLKLTNRALVLVWCHFVGGTFEATFHELGSRASLVPLRGIQQTSYKRLKTHKSSSRISLVPLRGRHLGLIWAALGLHLGCSWAVLGSSGPDFLLLS